VILTAGATVGSRYTITDFIGQGGMQEVYRAVDERLKRSVAIKTPKGIDGQKRFRGSAVCSARVNHPNAARTLDFWVEGEREFLAEELIEGTDLGEFFRRIPQLDPYAVAHLLHHLARGLAAVHQQGVVHRDIKPSNVMCVGGLSMAELKITDFGVARMAEAEIDAAVRGGLPSITGSKTLIGHLPYMAPEILQDRHTVSSAADVWAIGALAYQASAGHPPYGKELAEAVLNIVAAKPPPIPPEVDKHPQFKHLGRELHGIILKCLSRDPDDRPTATQLVGLCGRLCYPHLDRKIGRVAGYPGRSFGFIGTPGGEDVFFHTESVFGARPTVGSQVWYVAHPGEPRERAHPVLAILPEKVRNTE